MPGPQRRHGQQPRVLTGASHGRWRAVIRAGRGTWDGMRTSSAETWHAACFILSRDPPALGSQSTDHGPPSAQARPCPLSLVLESSLPTFHAHSHVWTQDRLSTDSMHRRITVNDKGTCRVARRRRLDHDTKDPVKHPRACARIEWEQADLIIGVCLVWEKREAYCTAGVC